MRTSEVATLDAEKLASLAWLDGQPYPAAELTENWKKITFNQFHDLAAGSGIAVIYKDAQKDYTEVFHADHEITDNSLHTLDAHIDTLAKQNRIKTKLPFSSSIHMAWPRSETVATSIQLPEPAETIHI